MRITRLVMAEVKGRPLNFLVSLMVDGAAAGSIIGRSRHFWSESGSADLLVRSRLGVQRLP